MNIGIIGSGVVGQTLAQGFAKAGHDVKIGTRNPDKLKEFLTQNPGIQVGSDADAAQFGELVVLCTAWSGAQHAIELGGAQNFEGKTVIDVTNPLKFETQGQAPTMAVAYPDSAGQQVQKWLPKAKIVKAFNTVPAHYMTNAKAVQEGVPDLFICGDDAEAKKTVSGIAQNWDWQIIDMGGIEQAYLLEALAMLWIRYGFSNNHWTHAFKLLRK